MKISQIVLAVIVTIVALFSVRIDLMPTTIEIDNIELVYVVGMDKLNNGMYETTILRDKETETSLSQNEGENTSSKETVSVYSETFTTNKEKLSKQTEKYLSMAHVDYYIIGKSIANEELQIVNDFIAHDPEGALDSQILIVNEGTAKQFVDTIAKDNINLSELIENDQKSVFNRNYTVEVSAIDLSDMMLNDEKANLLPLISISKISTTNESKQHTAYLNGAVILQNKKIVGQLSEGEVETYNLIKGNIASFNVTIGNIHDTDQVAFEFAGLTVKNNYLFDDNNLNKIVVNVTGRAKYQEVHTQVKIDSEDVVKKYEQKLKNTLQTRIIELFQKQKSLSIDFIKIESDVYRKHPYKYMKIKQAGKSINVYAEVETNLNISIENIFDIVNTSR